MDSRRGLVRPQVVVRDTSRLRSMNAGLNYGIYK